ncbi:MAG: PQQ-binding-like beta-propeller repeat protein, partial [Anaerolineae bacterium]|nr:PQQ-binding-like beta-propeller repeat protein [Anaerolineae bacterium]
MYKQLFLSLFVIVNIVVSPLILMLNASDVQASSPKRYSTNKSSSDTLAIPSASDEATSWSMAGANAQRTSWVAENVDPGASNNFGVQWYRPIEAYIGQHVQLITARDKVYASTARGLYALDAATGNEVWRFDTEMPLGHSPTVVDGVVYVGGFDKRVYALNADTGSLIWTFEEAKGGFSTNPLVVDGKVLMGSRDGYFYALNKDNGSLSWQYPSKSSMPLGPILYSAAYKDGKVFFASNNNYGYALDVDSGALLWKSAKMPGDGFQAWWPVVYGNHVIFSSAIPYVQDGDPGTSSPQDVVSESDPYYAKMYNFQYGRDFVKTLQRDDVFHQGEANGAKLGSEFNSGSSGDTTGIQWGWGNGKSVVNASKVTEYLEDNGQTNVNQSTNKPWRRGVIVLNTSDGSEYTFDSDKDGRREYAPFLFVGTKSGNRYPPLVIPQGINGHTTDVLYAQNFDEYKGGWGISRARLTGWQWGTPYIRPVGGGHAIDEPFASSAGG